MMIKGLICVLLLWLVLALLASLAHNDEVAQRDEAKQKSGEVSVSFNKSEPCTGQPDVTAISEAIEAGKSGHMDIVKGSDGECTYDFVPD